MKSQLDVAPNELDMLKEGLGTTAASGASTTPHAHEECKASPVLFNIYKRISTDIFFTNFWLHRN